jgi:hypothetical protein
VQNVRRVLATAAVVLSTTVVLGGAAGGVAPAPRIWFAPVPRDTVVGQAGGFDGSVDFMSLFERSAPWSTAASQVSVFKLYGGWVANEASLPDLRRIVVDLKRRGIALAVEDAGLVAPSGCGQGVEGFAGAGEAARVAERIRAAGGRLDYVALDSPFREGTLYTGAGACGFSAEEDARQVARWAAAVRAIFPKAVVGDIEALPRGVDPAAVVAWMDAYRSVTGERLPFFHLDVNYLRLDWPEAARTLEAAAKARGVPFGIIYTGEGSQLDGGGSDADWAAAAEQRFTSYEARYGGRPDDAVLQSWVDHPDHVLPETQPSTFSWLVDRYARPRTRVRLALAPGRLTGRLSTADGAPVANARVDLSASPLAGPGVAGDYSLAGTVPRNATAAVLESRVGVDCVCTGAAEIRLYGARYDNRSYPPDAWASTGTAAAATEASDHGAGSMLHVNALAGGTFAANTAAVPVTAGARFSATFSARVAPLSRGSGYFAVSFRDASGAEVARRSLPLDTLGVALGSPRTDPAGRFGIRVGRLPRDQVRVVAWFRGDAARFPAYASL